MSSWQNKDEMEKQPRPSVTSTTVTSTTVTAAVCEALKDPATMNNFAQSMKLLLAEHHKHTEELSAARATMHHRAQMEKLKASHAAQVGRLQKKVDELKKEHAVQTNMMRLKAYKDYEERLKVMETTLTKRMDARIAEVHAECEAMVDSLRDEVVMR